MNGLARGLTDDLVSSGVNVVHCAIGAAVGLIGQRMDIHGMGCY